MHSKQTKLKSILIAIIALLLILIAGLAYILFGSKPALLSRQLDLGTKFYMDAKYEDAELYFKKAIEIDEKQVKPYIFLSKTYQTHANSLKDANPGKALSMYDEAESALSDLLAAVPDLSNADLEGISLGLNSDDDSKDAAERIQLAMENIVKKQITIAESNSISTGKYEKKLAEVKSNTKVSAFTDNSDNTSAMTLLGNNKNTQNITESSASAENETIDDNGEDITTERKDMFDQGKMFCYAIYTKKGGKNVKVETFLPDGTPVDSYTYQYDEKNRELTSPSISAGKKAGQINKYTLYIYNNKDQIIKNETHKLSDDELTGYTEFTYDEKGRKEFSDHYYLETSSTGERKFVHDTKRTYTYDDQDRLLLTKSIRDDGTLIDHNEYEYNKNGEKIVFHYEDYYRGPEVDSISEGGNEVTGERFEELKNAHKSILN